MEKTSEKMKFEENQAACIIGVSKITESMRLGGRFHTELWTPKDGRREECIALLFEADYLRERGIQPEKEKIFRDIYKSLLVLKEITDFKNVVTDVGANLMMNQAFGTTSYLGLISSVGYTGIPVVGDTMASMGHASSNHVWVEAGNGSNYPLWSTPTSNARATVTWSSTTGRSKAIASAASFIFVTTGGTLKGCFICTGSGAVATNNDTNGTLYSAGVFTGGDRVVQPADTLNVSYNTTG